MSFLVRSIFSLVMENNTAQIHSRKLSNVDSYKGDDAMSLHWQRVHAFITNTESNFVKFSISIKDRIKYLILKSLNMRLKCSFV